MVVVAERDAERLAEVDAVGPNADPVIRYPRSREVLGLERSVGLAKANARNVQAKITDLKDTDNYVRQSCAIA